jgi:hypothetical protein
MFYACVQIFNVTGNLEKFLELNMAWCRFFQQVDESGGADLPHAPLLQFPTS